MLDLWLTSTFYCLHYLITHITLVENGNEPIPKGSHCTDIPSKQVSHKMNNYIRGDFLSSTEEIQYMYAKHGTAFVSYAQITFTRKAALYAYFTLQYYCLLKTSHLNDTQFWPISSCVVY
jgi:DNA polymerase III alpha subunit (gram-positive type)